MSFDLEALAQQMNMKALRTVQASGYSEAGASRNRRSMKGFTAKSSSPNEDINWNSMLLRQRGRMLFMSSPVARSAIETNRTKVVGTGLTPKPELDLDLLHLTPDAAKAWQRKTVREWTMWASKKENCDAIGMNNFAGMQQLVVSNSLVNGDLIGVRQMRDPTPLNPYSLRVQLVEADRISTPNNMRLIPGGSWTDGRNPKTGNRIYDGVEVDKHGMVVAYWICNIYPNQMLRERDKIEWKRVRAYSTRTGLPNIFHVMESERPDQYRGVSFLAPDIESLLNISRYTQSELMAALIQSFFTAWIETETNPAAIPMNERSEERRGG